MTPDLSRMVVFAQIVEHRSFSEAARRLGLSKAGVSKQVARLERDLGVRLLNRTTRRVRPTEAGLEYYESCSRVIAEAERAELKLSKLQREPMGRLHVNGPIYLGATWLMPAVLAFMRRFPAVNVDLSLEDRFVDLIEQDVDVAIRLGRLSDSSLVVRKLATVRQVVCASPAYLRRRGTPRKPADLVGHEWLTYMLGSGTRLRFNRRGRRHAVTVSGRFRTNSGFAIREALLAGLGITMPPSFIVADALRDKRLREVLGEYARPEMTLCAVYPHTSDVAAKVRLFVDFLQNDFPVDGQATEA